MVSPSSVLATILLAVGCGWIVASAGESLSATVLWAAMLLTTTVLGVMAGRYRMNHIQGTPASDMVIEGESHHQYARWTYYAALVTMPWLVLRFWGTTLSDYLFALALLLTVVGVVGGTAERTPQLPPFIVGGVAMLLLGGCLATLARSLAPLESFVVLARVGYLLTAWLLVGMVVLRTPRHVRLAVTWWVGGAAICGLYAAGQGSGLIAGGVDQSGRVIGLAEHVNDLGTLSAVAAAPALVLAYVSRHWLAWVGVAGVAAGLLLSVSVGAALALVVALMVATVSVSLARAVVVFVVVGIFALLWASAAGILVSTPLDRLTVATDVSAQYGQGTLYTRQHLLDAAIRGIRSDPFIGTGLDGKSSGIYLYGRTYRVHNLVVASWYEAGLAGVVGMLVILWGFLATSWSTVLQARGDDRLLAVGLLSGTVAYLVVGMSEPLLYQRFALAPGALAVALAASQRRIVAGGLRTSQSSTQREATGSGRGRYSYRWYAA